MACRPEGVAVQVYTPSTITPVFEEPSPNWWFGVRSGADESIVLKTSAIVQV